MDKQEKIMLHRFFYKIGIFLPLILFPVNIVYAETDPLADDLTNSALEAIKALGGENDVVPDTDPTVISNEDQQSIPAENTDQDTDDAIPPTDTPDNLQGGLIEEQVQVTTDISDNTMDEMDLTKPVIKDVILVLDNSGSMKKNDPQFLTSQAVTEFITSLDEATRVAILIFDQDVRFAVPLTVVSIENRETILQSLEQINYKGLYTDTPAAIERAIYELKTNSRDDAKKLIIFMTDGIVDTGNAAQDLEKSKWLKEDLSADAADSEIKIFGIAFTENADFQLIQSLAQKTEGEYFRALQPENLNNVFEQIQEIINKRPEPVVEPPQQQIIQPLPAPPPPPPEPVIIEVPVQPSQDMAEEERLRSMVILIALGVLIIAVVLMIFMLIKGARKKDSDEDYAHEAYFNDINGFTPQPTYKLGAKPTMLGRVAGKDSEHLNYIVIPETTIGRRHALIEFKDFAYWIIDQGSINGTFVNDQPISSEVRLKHGDRIRLHKCEFEFLMPEMDAGDTVISKTVLAGAGGGGNDATVASGSREESKPSADDFDLDITGSIEDEEESESPTIIKESPDSDEEMESNEGDVNEGSDETIMLDDDHQESDMLDSTIRSDLDDDEEDSDETLMPGDDKNL